MANRRAGDSTRRHMLEPVRPEVVLPDRALCLPTFSHFLVVNKTPPPPLESLSLSFLAGKCCVILRALLSQKAEGEHRSSRSHLAIESLCNIRQAGRGVEQELTALMRLLVLCFASFVIIVCSDLSSVASQPRQRACSAAALRSLHLGQLFQYRPRMWLQEASMSEVFVRQV